MCDEVDDSPVRARRLHRRGTDPYAGPGMCAVEAADLEPHSHDPELRCSPWTRAQRVDPIGSAGRFDQLLLVEWPLPWPSDVGDVPMLAAAASDPRARVMMVVPRTEDAADGLARVVHHRRVATHRLRGVDHRLEHDAVPDLLAGLLDAPERDQHDWPSVVGDAPPEVLVCGHGRRDACCGRWGTLLHVELAARQSDVRVWRCSHTGGHRYAPTAITLPDGRAWAYADADLVHGVMARGADVTAVAPHDRGCVAFDPWAQVVERALLTRLGWAWLDHQVTEARTDVAPGGRSAHVHLRWTAPDGATDRADADVVITRDLPVPVCGEPLAAATKVSPEYALARLDIPG